jgi:ketol-acid reductoisomerase
MRTLLKDIQSGAFADEWMAEHEGGKVKFKQLENEALNHPIEEVGKQLRGMMPWLQRSRLVDKAKN